jgi:hypothetical protein
MSESSVDIASRRRGALAERVRATLASDRMPYAACLLAALLSLPALFVGFTTDDQSFRYAIRHGQVQPLSLFTFGARIIEHIQLGWFSWWTNPELTLSFFRPLSSLLLFGEFTLWPDTSWPMHLISIGCYVAMVAVAARVYAQLIPDRLVRGLALLLFAIDDGHAQAIGWIASRNSLLTVLCSLLALSSHIAARVRPHPKLPWLSALWCALGLCSGEAGVASFAYLAAYTWLRESGPFRRRLRAIAPQLGVSAAWFVFYVAGGYGSHGASFYRDVADPVHFALEGTCDLPVWFLSLLGPSVAVMVMAAPLVPARLIALLVVLPLMAAIWFRRHELQWYAVFALGSLLCLPPLLTTWPQDRLLIGASFGAFPVIAGFICDVARMPSARGQRRLRVLSLVSVTTQLRTAAA